VGGREGTLPVKAASSFIAGLLLIVTSGKGRNFSGGICEWNFTHFLVVKMSFRLPVTLVASGELKVVLRVEEYVNKKPKHDAMKQQNKKDGSDRYGYTASACISPVNTDRSSEIGAPSIEV
jgi:hypothetical protein